MDKIQHLESVVETHRITQEENLLTKYKERNTEVKDLLKNHYLDNIYTPFNSGSYAKNTAINTKFDFDLICPFKRNAFGTNGTLKNMYENLFEFLVVKYEGVAKVERQKVSIGIEFYPDEDSDLIKIDVVPGRELNQDQYKDDENLNLYVYYQYGNIEAGSERLKTNVEAQISNIKDRATAELNSVRKIIRLLKIWKFAKGSYPTKSFLLELITLKAFDNCDIQGNLWDKLKIVLEYIRDNVQNESFSLKDPGNGSNDLIDTLTYEERANFSSDINNTLLRIEENSENIRTYFPENMKFKEEDQNHYATTGAGLFSIPPKTNFG